MVEPTPLPKPGIAKVRVWATPGTVLEAPTHGRIVPQAHGHIDFDEVELRAKELAQHIDVKRAELVGLLTAYETYDVANDEIDRTLDLLRSIGENQRYFERRVGPVASFLPRNQPLYAFACFIVVPSLMASEVHFRTPRYLHALLPQLLKFIDVATAFPNAINSPLSRLEFLRERSAVLVDPLTGRSRPLTEVVIFTGTPAHADQLRRVFDRRTLFIANGAGHNPVVVADNAAVHEAVEAVARLQFYNQGQDCAAPNAVLVQAGIYDSFMDRLRKTIKATKVGPYQDPLCSIGPITDPEDLIRVQRIFVHNRRWLDDTCPGSLSAQSALVTPAIIARPLIEGGNFEETFAPVVFVQRYDNDADLAQYFEHKHYARHAMYVTVYGSSQYVESLVHRRHDGHALHDATTVLRNTHLHARGVERGTQPYGGYGYGASSISLAGRTVAKPTLPQRDIFEYLVEPCAATPAAEGDLQRFVLKTRDVEKLLRLVEGGRTASTETSEAQRGQTYLEADDNGRHYVALSARRVHVLLARPNFAHLAQMDPQECGWIRDIVGLLQQRPSMGKHEYESALYAIPVQDHGLTPSDRRRLQRRFFRHVYQLMFGTESGPRLDQFLWDVDVNQAIDLIAPIVHGKC